MGPGGGFTGELASALHQPLPQAAKIITYKEPDNPEYSGFLKQLKLVAREQFNFTMEDGLVGGVLGPFSVTLCWSQPVLSAVPGFQGLPFSPFPLFPHADN